MDELFVKANYRSIDKANNLFVKATVCRLAYSASHSHMAIAIPTIAQMAYAYGRALRNSLCMLTASCLVMRVLHRHHVSMEVLLQILLACPKCWRVFGGVVCSVCTTLFFVSWGLMRRLDRVEGRFGLQLPDQVFDALPLATTGWGLFMLAVAAATGWYVAWCARWLERRY